jgi:Mrp family chromosome partitioning ATPase
VGGRDEVMEATGLPVLAEFPALRRGAVRLSAEAAGFFHTNVALATRGVAPRVVLVTCPTRPFEKAGVAMSLAENFARSGQRTLLVDADLRHPGLTERLDLVPNSTVSLDAYLADPDRPFLPVGVAIGGTQSFDFVPSFTAERFPADLLNEGFQGRLDDWKASYDVIVFDAAPVVPFADTLAIAPSCTGVVLSVSATRSTRDKVDDALELLEGPRVPVLGIALTEVRGAAARAAREGRPDGPAKDGVRTRVPPQRRSKPRA